MTYILMDLEWNAAYSRRQGKFVNEIIQIGAVKLDDNLKFVDDISIMVHSQITKKLSNRFKNLTHISNDDMLAGVPLHDAIEKYNAWVGNNTVTLTWSTSDLYAIIENCKYFADGAMFKIEKYVDLQGFVQDWLHRNGHEFKGQISLKSAAEMMTLTTEGLELHTARDDSMLSAELFRRTFDKARLEKVCKDASKPEFYERLLFKPYSITSINDSSVDKETLRFKCDKCGTYAKRKTKWIYKNHWFSANFKCRRCGNCFTGKLAFKKHYDCVVTKRITTPIKKRGEKKSDMQSVSAQV